MMITKDLLKAMRPEMDKALAEVGKLFRVTIRTGSATYTPDGSTGHFKVELLAIGQDGTVADPLRDTYPETAQMVGLPPLDSKFSWMGEIYTITGMDTGRRKYSVRTSRVRDGKTFFFPVATIRSVTHPASPPGCGSNL